MKAAQFFRLGRMIIKQVSAKRPMAENCPARAGRERARRARQPIAVSDISIYICLIDIRDGSSKPVYGGVDRLQALSSAKTGRRSCFFMN